MRKIGFTLIELLVVIAIIAVLIAFLASVLQGTRQRAKDILCSSNIKQLSLAIIAYDQENGTFPPGFDDLHGSMAPPGGYLGDAAYDKMGWWWFHFLADTMENTFDKETVLWCPSRRISNPAAKEILICGNYGVNRSICKDTPGLTGIIGSEFVGTPLGQNQIRRPASTLLIADSGYGLISWCGVTNASIQFFDNPKTGNHSSV